MAVVVVTSVVRVCESLFGGLGGQSGARVWGLAVAAWGRLVVSADRMGGKVLWRAWRVSARGVEWGWAVRVGWWRVRAVSKRARPCSVVIGVRPVRVRRAWSVALEVGGHP